MITYRIAIADLHAHQFRVTLTLPAPAADQELSLPVWIPGSYLVREFARHLSDLQATQGGVEVPLIQADKTRWRAACKGRTALVVSYLVYAFDNSVRTAFLDAQRGFFNGTGMCLRAEGRENEPHAIEIGRLPAGWQVATGMKAAKVDARGQGRYEAADYDELVDHPFELGRFWRGEFVAAGVPHEFVIAGALPSFDGERLLADTRKICEAEIAFWHGTAKRGKARAPFERYVFMLNAVEDGYGGLEHRASTALIANRRDLPRLGQEETSDAYVKLLGLISHEYFHTWNVKRLRPDAFIAFDYSRENYTELLWFFEGFTSYYDDLFLVRQGLIDERRYLELISRTVTGVLDSPGRKVQSVARSSFDAWTKYYRQDENTPNSTISYYTKGAMLAMALDLSLRTDDQSRGSLDDVMRGLWSRSGGGPIAEQDVVEVVEQVAGRSMATELRAWIHGTDDLPLPALLERVGVRWGAGCKPSLSQRLGLRVAESALTGVRATHVLTASAAQAAGLSAGDELLACNGWRLRRLDDALLTLDAARPDQLELLVSRDQRVLNLALKLPQEVCAVPIKLSPAEKANARAIGLRRAWLTG
ncbi:M61 family metallopeptidase [Roseateles toxinivorans]|uniref:Putative metalloprotease with PDZ domain n=1 Tax=Roseateles toxinivorans TaxID=270368 RepID=A0A4R6QMN2_9BURK|nr:M61 family metallopeptidase [Roseateles toxinivorans]TDP71380.1 putative metalloprotease with PDZ domain [Roseateles toxinivorans]